MPKYYADSYVTTTGGIRYCVFREDGLPIKIGIKTLAEAKKLAKEKNKRL